MGLGPEWYDVVAPRSLALGCHASSGACTRREELVMLRSASRFDNLILVVYGN